MYAYVFVSIVCVNVCVRMCVRGVIHYQYYSYDI